MSDEPTPRTGSWADLSKRVDAIDGRVDSLSGTVGRLEANIDHLAELNKLRFDSIEKLALSVDSNLKSFIGRMDGLMSGEIQTNQTREARQLVADYNQWHGLVDNQIATLQARWSAQDAVREDEAKKTDSRIRNWGAFGAIVGGLFSGLVTLIVNLANHH